MKSSLLSALFIFVQTITFSQQTEQGVLFDFSASVFPNGSDKTRMDWEKEFIEFGKKTEKNPANYIKHLFKWFQLGEEGQELYSYRFSYLYGSCRYEYESYVDDEYNLWASKESTREGYLFNHISRSGENVQRLWGLFGELAISIVKPHLVEGKKERIYLEVLASAWECIKEKKKYTTKLDKIYQVLTETWLYSEESNKAMRMIQCESLNQRLKANPDQNLQYETDWIYSFWVRRHHEGNADQTYEIIQELLK